ncbi:hypothetical protein GCM10007108_15410 [Thermogymnomonas acidicola]|uniref:DUF1641 domain-containing protein n=1 Tax=Thermogymnomonas acidicola TaxID=399579 RepID=A0AA37FA23_9ARCH|nr:DUF1641 domain-containing protein [Thermogymnomonas acidicola]GGM78148.1 hypothetical protein GCM10007108_15410 [Thermogymnomonas acidicola]
MSEEEMVQNTEANDDIEPLIRGLIENRDAIESMLNFFAKLKKAGVLDMMEGLSEDYLPTDIEFIVRFFSSKEFSTALIKGANVLMSLLHALSNETVGDSIKTIAYNSENIWDAMVSGAKNPINIGMLRLMAILRDPDVAAGFTAVIAALREIGAALRKVPQEPE